MKKIFYIALGIFSMSLTTSCDKDLLDPYTPGALTEEIAFQTPEDLQQLLNSSYASLNSRAEAEFVSVFTDEVGIGYANGGQGINDDYVFFLTQNSWYPANLWIGSYSALARINRVIAFADKIPAANAEETKKLQNMKAQAKILRAYTHLRLLGYFTTNMTDDNALSALKADRVFASNENANPRVKNGDMYAFIHSDLDDAIATLTANSVAFDQITASINFAKGLKARAYAYKGDYVNAETYADQVITTSGVALATPVQYRQVFFSDSNPAGIEVIFKFKRTNQQNAQGYNLHNAWCSISPNYDGSPFYEIGRALFNLLPTTGDVRRSVIVAPTSKIDPAYATSSDYRNTDVLVINKHGGTISGSTTAATTAANTLTNDIKIMRISEMYLIKAEARAKAVDYPGVVAALKPVIDARYGASQTITTPSSPQQAWARILRERRIEFAYEGHRFIDLKRLGTLAGVGIDRHPADYSSSSANYPGANPINLPMTSHKWALPVPQTEISINPTIQQNPGYN